MSRFLRSRLAPAVLIAVAIAASAVRWLIQDSHNLYTAVSKRFYVPDPDLGWRVSTQHPVWLGLEVIGVMLAIAVAILVAGAIVRRRPRLSRVVVVGAWLAAVACVAVPVIAFASGPGPLGGQDNLPARAAVAIEAGIAGKLDAPAGAYTVVKHEGTAVTAHLSAGGESFDARFADVSGRWQGDPRDLGGESRGAVSVAAASVDTGVGERSKHARDKYLDADKYPQISVDIDRVEAVRQISPGEIAFRAKGSVHLMGRTHVVDIVGTLARPDAAALQRLGLAGEVLLVQADFFLLIAETALAPDAHDFDGDRFPIHVSLVLRRSP